MFLKQWSIYQVGRNSIEIHSYPSRRIHNLTQEELSEIESRDRLPGGKIYPFHFIPKINERNLRWLPIKTTKHRPFHATPQSHSFIELSLDNSKDPHPPRKSTSLIRPPIHKLHQELYKNTTTREGQII